ncbi:MAG TPA: sensor histidine kinase [Ktedonobacterales bacterium]
MSSMHTRMTTTLAPSHLWASRWVVRLRIVYVVLGIAYLSRVVTTGRLALADFLLLTVIYGAWLVVFRLGRHLDERPPSRGWYLALCGVACASQFIALSGANLSWFPILTTMTACLVTGISPRYLSLIACGGLWLSSSLAFALSMHGWDLNAQLTLLLSFGSFVGFSVMFRELMLAHTALEGSNAELAVAHSQLQAYSAQAEEMAAIRERNRIAREIHDTLGHSLTLLAVQLETATQFEARGDPGLKDELREAQRVAKSCLTDVRHSVAALRPDDAAVNSLQDGLRALVAEFAVTCRDIAIELDLDEATQTLSPDLSITLYRCAQEALTNIRKHARATKVLVSLSTSDGPDGHPDGHPDGRVELSVLDNGQGYSAGAEELTPGYGLLGMRERVAALGGTVMAGPGRGQGWCVEVVIPCAPRSYTGASAAASAEAPDEG